MALTVTTDLADITLAESTTNWLWIGAQSGALEPDFFVQGNNCISRAVSNTTKGMVYDFGSGIDFTTGTHKDKLVYIWMKTNTPGLCATRESGGMVVRLATTSATADYRDWYVDGSNTLEATDGWICYVIDPQSAGTSTSGSYSAANVRYFGGYITTTTTAKGQNFGIDAIRYGRGEIYVSGTNTVTGEGFKEIAAVDYGTINNRWGIVTQKQGVYYVRGKLILGHGTNNTTFSSQDETVIWETPSYYNGSNVVQSIPASSVGSTTGTDGRTNYAGIAFRGGTGTTSITFGVVVGSDNGRSGPTLSVTENVGLTTPARVYASIAASDDAMTLALYGTTFQGFSVVDLEGTNVDGDASYANTFNECAVVESNMAMRNTKILNALTEGYYWKTTSDFSTALFVNNPNAIYITSTAVSPITLTNISFSGNTNDIRNYNADGGTEDSYLPGVTDASVAIGITYTQLGQSFAPSSAGHLSAMSFKLAKVGSPTGNVVAKLYSHTGTYGSTGTPLTLLATSSDVVDASTLPTSGTGGTEYWFSFSGYGTNISLTDTYYVAVVECPSQSAGNTVVVYGSSTLGHGGNVSVYSSIWNTSNTMDAYFRVYSNGDVEVAYSGGNEPSVLNDAPWASTIVSSSVNLTMVVTDSAGSPISGALAYIDNNDISPYIMNTTTNGSGVATVAYTGAAVSSSRWRVRKYGYKQFKQLVDISSSDITLYVTLVSDPQQV